MRSMSKNGTFRVKIITIYHSAEENDIIRDSRVLKVQNIR